MLNRNNEFDSSKAERELGFRCRPFSESIRDTVAWMQEESFLNTEERSRVVDVDPSLLLQLLGKCVIPSLNRRYCAGVLKYPHQV